MLKLQLMLFPLDIKFVNADFQCCLIHCLKQEEWDERMDKHNDDRT